MWKGIFICMQFAYGNPVQGYLVSLCHGNFAFVNTHAYRQACRTCLSAKQVVTYDVIVSILTIETHSSSLTALQNQWRAPTVLFCFCRFLGRSGLLEYWILSYVLLFSPALDAVGSKHHESWPHLSFSGPWPCWFRHYNSGCPGLVLDHLKSIPNAEYQSLPAL